MKRTLNRLIRNERGQALLIVLVLMLVGGLIIAPLLSHVTTGLKAGRVHEQLMQRNYAADAGVWDALWKIMNNQVPETMPYFLTVNGKNVAVEIDSVWILEGLEEWKPGTHPHAWLVALGRPIDLTTGQYEIMVTCDLTGAYERKGGVKVERIGVWLPGTFDYVGPCSGITSDDPIPTDIRGGIAWIWDLSPPLHFPNKELTTQSQSFYIEPTDRDPPGDFAWVRTVSSDIYLSWDPEFTNSAITSIASDNTTGEQTKVVAHAFTELGGEAGIIAWESSLE